MNKILKTILPVASAAAVIAPTICLASCGATKVNVDKWSPDTFKGCLVSEPIEFKKNQKYNIYVNFDDVIGGPISLENAVLEFSSDLEFVETDNIKAYWVDEGQEKSIKITPSQYQITVVQTAGLDTDIPGIFFENIKFNQSISVPTIVSFHFIK